MVRDILELSAFGIYAHAISVAMVIGFSAALLIFEYLAITKNDGDYKRAAKAITRALVVVFAFGAATGTIVEFGLVQIWNGIILAIATYVLMPLYLELVAFIIEGALLVALLYTWDKFRNPWTHFTISAVYMFGAWFSGALITAVNSWMQAPWGVGNIVKLIYPWAPLYGPNSTNTAFLIELKSALVSSVAGGIPGSALLNPQVILSLANKYGPLLKNPFIAFYNPYALYSIIHQLLASTLVGLSWIASASAIMALIRKEEKRYYVKIFKTAALAASIIIFIQAIGGHFQGLVVYEYQPTKFAMIAGLDVSKPNPILGLTITHNPNHVFTGFDKLLEIAKNHPNPELKIGGISARDIALTDTQKAFEKMHIIYPMYEIKIGLAGVMLIFSIAFFIAYAYPRVWNKYEDLLLKIGITPGIIVPAIAALGWAVREIGRKPWTVYGLLYPEELLTTFEISPAVIATVITAILVSLTFMMIALYIVLLRPPKFLGGE